MALLAVGCGGSSGVDSGVDGTKKGSEVTEDEAKKVCEATLDYQESQANKADACRAAGFAMAAFSVATAADDAAVVKACTDAVDACNSAEPQEPTTDPCAAAGPIAGCDNTVDEVEACLTEKIDAGAAALKDVPDCSELSKTYFETYEPSEPAEAEACKTVDPVCVPI
ncbi:MAG TPA: hypothetical protein VLC09_20585 [Polyangiaceae bacterium]|nr:hypothetical protein [Polyangiaceae bacterium]